MGTNAWNIPYPKILQLNPTPGTATWPLQVRPDQPSTRIWLWALNSVSRERKKKTSLYSPEKLHIPQNLIQYYFKSTFFNSNPYVAYAKNINIMKGMICKRKFPNMIFFFCYLLLLTLLFLEYWILSILSLP